MEWIVPSTLIEGTLPTGLKGSLIRIGPVVRSEGVLGKEEHDLERDAALMTLTFTNTNKGVGVVVRFKEVAPIRRTGKKICTQSPRRYGILSDLNTYIQYRSGVNNGWYHSTNFSAHLQDDILVLSSPFGKPTIVDPYTLTPLGTHPSHKNLGRVRTLHNEDLTSKKNIGFTLRRCRNSFQLVVSENSKPSVTVWVPPTLVSHDFVVTDHYYIFYLCGGWQASEVLKDLNVTIGLTPPVNHLDMDKNTNQFYDDSKNSLLLVPRVVEKGAEPKILTIPIRGFVVSFGGIVRDLRSEIILSAVVASNFRLTDTNYSSDESSLHLLRVDLTARQCLQTSVVRDVNDVVMHSLRETMPCRYAYCWSQTKLIKYDCSTGSQTSWSPPQFQSVAGVTFVPPSETHVHHQEDDAHLIVQLNHTDPESEGSHFSIICAATLTVTASVPIPMQLPPSSGSAFFFNKYLVAKL
eukprot:TRINITY_DN4033_c0_g1_i1.p1 TRINITY_DN4033_c0_g1~~TRINITY_DN4033_c0_g1_i1.p1  ORF type:complete len:464 (+),score=59.98 TRINITY_DN4033_c0_g1_i1:75-1466(+)